MWQLHCAKNTLKSLLPFQQRLRSLKRRLGLRRDNIAEASVYPGGFDQVFLLRSAGLDVRGRDILEIGTGWYPVIPLMLRVAGARHVYLTDAHELLDLKNLKASLDFLRPRVADMASRFDVPEAEIEAKLKIPETQDLVTALTALGMSYYVPFDHKDVSFKVDAIISHTVLEHIQPEVIMELLCNARHVLRTGGMISHGIDHSDHRANADQRLNRVDFLRYSDRVWKYLCLDPHDYTNRLRHSDYVAMVKDAGFSVVYERALVDEKTRATIGEIPLAFQFQGRDPDDLSTLWSNIVAKLGSEAA
jgi:SAM-dependent methyltransferase